MTVETYDFNRPSTLAREHSRVLELGFETFARQWSTQLTAKVRAKAVATSDYVLMQTYDEYVAQMPSMTVMVLCSVPGHSARIVVQFPVASALDWIARMLGGRCASVPERKLTPLEATLVGRLTTETLEDLRYSLGSLITGPMVVEGIQHNAQFAQAAAITDLMVVAGFTLRVGQLSGSATVAIPADLLLARLGAANPVAGTEGARELVESQLAAVPLDVALSLEPLAVRPADILALGVGDVLRLNHTRHRPFDLTVSGRTIGRAAVGTSGSRLAAHVTALEENNP
ncbi:flagellar motor switch protein FliM [Zafaria cholistanensis]|uniref:Flagellar motor switch protein FliM n=1 Tax=Zafaria cholistanensis TaxID=1682741 RepID=A0A5A7NLL0_9MICC|nr:flagellar motor switch protein FliM [Zafaria cholistanensis]GER21660.1 flagellar motor switch protein FliM [Zafaria cholistanensis]